METSTLDKKIKSPLLYVGEDDSQRFVHETYRDFYLGQEMAEKFQAGRYTLKEFYDFSFQTLGGFDKWKNLSYFVLDMIEEKYTPQLLIDIKNDSDLSRVCTVKQELPNGQDSNLIVQIDDYYCTYKAQKVIQEMQKILIEKYGFNLILREGLTGTLDTSPFDEFSDKEIKAEVCDYFMKQGKITADEALSITTDLDFVSWGIENEREFSQYHEQVPEMGRWAGDPAGKAEINVKNGIRKMIADDADRAIFMYGSSFVELITRNFLINGFSYLRLNPIFEGGSRDEKTYQKVLKGEKTPFEKFLQELGKD